VRALAGLLFLAACSTGDSEPATLAPAQLDDAIAPASLVGRATVRHAPQLANVPGGLPLVIPDGRPIVGRPWRCVWTTRPTASFPDHRTALLISFSPPPEPQPIPLGRGGMLMVDLRPDLTVQPKAGTYLTQHEGVVEASVTFPPHLVGLQIWMQLVVEDPRTGVTTSPMLHVVVGNR